MKKPLIKIDVRADNYAALEVLAGNVIAAMAANPISFPSPSPSLIILQTAATALKDSVTAWGVPGARAGRKQLLHLRHVAIQMRNLLLKEAAYVSNLVDLSASPEEQGKFIALSGFASRSERGPQGILEAVRNFHRVITPRLNPDDVMLRWQKPLNVTSNANVKAYLIFRSLTEHFSDAVFLDASTKTTYTDYHPVKNAINNYYIIPFNNAGRGAISKVVMARIF